MKKTKLTMYVIVDKNDIPVVSTLNYTRKDCILNFTINTTTMNWRQTKKYGWKCQKVDVDIQTYSNSIIK